jgi:CBS domain-containing protein
MNVIDVCKRNVVTIGPAEELKTAAQLMRERHIGYLVVVEPSGLSGAPRPIGVLTDRDLVITVLAKGEDPSGLRAGDVMTRDPVTVREDKPLAFALSEMRRIGVRRLPVIDGAGQLTGILSLDDVLDALAAELAGVVGSIRSELHIEGALRP